jgi:hypothetical protein
MLQGLTGGGYLADGFLAFPIFRRVDLDVTVLLASIVVCNPSFRFKGVNRMGGGLVV